MLAYPFLTNPFGQSNSGPGVCHGPKGWGRNPEKSGPEGWGPELWGPEGWGAQNFAFFFPSPTTSFALFISHCVSLVVFGLCLEAPGPSNVHVRALGLWCETQAASDWPKMDCQKWIGQKWIGQKRIGQKWLGQKWLAKWIGQNWTGQSRPRPGEQLRRTWHRLQWRWGWPDVPLRTAAGLWLHLAWIG